jgi:hypothetical protein
MTIWLEDKFDPFDTVEEVEFKALLVLLTASDTIFSTFSVKFSVNSSIELKSS